MTTSLRLQLNEYFSTSPQGSWITADGTAEEFDVTLAWAYRTLRAMVSDGVLEEFKAPSRKVHRLVVAYRAVVVVVEVA